METKWSDVAHLYLRCNVFFDNKYWRMWRISGMYADLDVPAPAKRENCVHINEAKPVLRPMSDMNEEEMTSLLCLWYAPSDDFFKSTFHTVVFKAKEVKRHIIHGNGVGYSLFKQDGSHIQTGTLSFSRLNSFQFLYLLSKNFDLFYLIESGQALSTTTLK